MLEPRDDRIKAKPMFGYPHGPIDWQALYDMIIYDMGGQGPLMLGPEDMP